MDFFNILLRDGSPERWRGRCRLPSPRSRTTTTAAPHWRGLFIGNLRVGPIRRSRIGQCHLRPGAIPDAGPAALIQPTDVD